MSTIIILAIITTSIFFINMIHPLAMGLVLLLQSFLIALFIGNQVPSFWFSYILFLVFLGGLMVLFIYVTSLASNEMFSLSSFSLFATFPVMLTMILAFIFYDSWWQELSYYNYLGQTTSFLPFNLTKLYSLPTSLLTFFLIIYLLLTLIVVVNITKILEGPLRSSN